MKNATAPAAALNGSIDPGGGFSAWEPME
jgi:hypothetical protein